MAKRRSRGSVAERTMIALNQLHEIEERLGQRLDDASVRLVARVRARKLIFDREWAMIRKWMREALELLGEFERKPPASPDDDPRNANWTKIVRARKLAGRELPGWAAFWLWRLRLDEDPAFWKAIGRDARTLDRLAPPLRLHARPKRS